MISLPVLPSIALKNGSHGKNGVSDSNYLVEIIAQICLSMSVS